MTIKELELEPVTERTATILKEKHPESTVDQRVRTIAQQAHATTSNIVVLKDRQWIRNTYLAGGKLQKWVDDNPDART